MKLLVNGEPVEFATSDLKIEWLDGRALVRTPEGTFSAAVTKLDGKTLISFKGQQYVIEKAGRVRAGAGALAGDLRAPMPGVVVSVVAAIGDAVTKGQRLLVMEAMKTQIPMNAPFDGKISQLPVAQGDQVNEGALLVEVTP